MTYSHDQDMDMCRHFKVNQNPFRNYNVVNFRQAVRDDMSALYSSILNTDESKSNGYL